MVFIDLLAAQGVLSRRDKLQYVTYSTSLQTSDLIPDLSEWLSGCAWESVQERNENEKDRAMENQKLSANVSKRKALSNSSVQPQLVFSRCSTHGFWICQAMTTCEITAQSI